MKLYMSVAEHLRERIEKGVFSGGTRLPSVRTLSNDHGVSLTTVQQAYRQLESDGLIESKPQSGYYVKTIQTLPHPAEAKDSVDLSTAHSEFQESIAFEYYMEHPGLLFGTGYPCINAPSMTPLFTALHRQTKYYVKFPQTRRDPAGLLVLREHISRLMLDASCQSQAEDVIITNGCKEALFIALKACCEPGDLVAVESPCYFGILELFKIAGVKPVEIPADPVHGLSLEALTVALETLPIKVAYLSPNCNNPQGYTMSDVRKRHLLNMADKYDITLIEDDIYSELSYLLPRPRPIKSWDSQNRVILCSSFSKTLTPDIKTGWIYATCQQNKLLNLKLMTSGMTALTPQLAIAQFIEQGHYAKHIRKMRRLYRQHLTIAQENVLAHFPEGTHFTLPQGGYHLWINLPGELRVSELCNQLELKKIKISPGTLFSPRKRFSSSIRLSYSSLHLCDAHGMIASLAKSVEQCLIEAKTPAFGL
ncbi:PLP-dependent aminotransferase family protein [Prodigiosinella confusarubida]|uniref:PLP-dependent aminotransferase family protein n=2 Tax=Serratia sp. (strain ATCC 39006) TaxID=104623 RepID=A0A2I5TKE4_SERS3|nr:PLP-dependent aminotransferase family protein [Serratia sp. ATCC 39006]AUH00720.1 PLP-dependent aminotransferase family protein [Serratia sp. ATCC 39006]AUH05041.1 PLP-dependent aminotransferase family protein [Serratia sp. ATCC 39006]